MLKYLGSSVLIVLGTLALGFAGLRKSPPVYAGKTVNEWLNAGYEDAALAVQHIGPPAIPYIFRKLSREDPQFGSEHKYGELWKKCPIYFRALLPRPTATNFDEWRACSALLEIGPAAIPLVSAGLQNGNPGIREVSAHVLKVFHERGVDLSKARPLLLVASRDSEPEVRKYATAALGREPW
jgi:hypothetical protein